MTANRTFGSIRDAARYLLDEANSLIEEYPKWWEVSVRTDAEYSRLINASLDAAQEVQKTSPDLNEIRRREGVFRESLASLDRYLLNLPSSRPDYKFDDADARLLNVVSEVKIAVEGLGNKGSEGRSNAAPNRKANSRPEPVGFETLKMGSSGARVVELQKALGRIGLYKGVFDGMFGAQTAVAVRGFQTDYELPRTGEVDEQTYERIQLILSQRSENAPAGEGTGTSPTERAYWLLKMDYTPKRKDKDGMLEDYTRTFRSNEEWEYFRPLKVGDELLGYAPQDDAIVGVFTIGDESLNRSGGRFRRKEDLARPISRREFDYMIDDKSFFDSDGPPLIVLNKELYEEVLQLGKGAVPGTPPKKPRSSFFPSFATEGNHSQTDDKLQFTADVESLATVVSLKSVVPPLAIGLFGNWGSGKSFFMDKLYHKIEALKGSDENTYVDHVVHV
jgi:peptidoglycan hydrolase-like protein with peptidoglycan-binding domain